MDQSIDRRVRDQLYYRLLLNHFNCLWLYEKFSDLNNKNLSIVQEKSKKNYFCINFGMCFSTLNLFFKITDLFLVITCRFSITQLFLV